MCGDKVPKPHGNAYPLAALTDLYVHQDENFKSRLSLLVLVNVVLNRTVVVDSVWRFDNLYAVVIFGVKVSCITSVDGIILWLWIWLVNYVAMLLVVCQLSQMLLAMKTRDQWLVRFDPSIVTVKVIPWFCTAHLLLRITRWPPWKRACEVTLLKRRWPKRNAIAIFACGCFLPRWDSVWWECA